MENHNFLKLYHQLKKANDDIKFNLRLCLRNKIISYNDKILDVVKFKSCTKQRSRFNRIGWTATSNFPSQFFLSWDQVSKRQPTAPLPSRDCDIFYPCRWHAENKSSYFDIFHQREEHDVFTYLNSIIDNNVVIGFHIFKMYDITTNYRKAFCAGELNRHIRNPEIMEKTGFSFPPKTEINPLGRRYPEYPSLDYPTLYYPLEFNFSQLQNDYPDFTTFLKPLEEAIDRVFENIHVFDELIETCYRQVVESRESFKQ